MKAISQSQINLYRSCPHAYELSYRYNCEPMMFDPSILYVGRAVHDAIDKYYKHSHTQSTDKALITSLTYKQLRNEWDTTLPVDYLKKAYQCIQNFAEFESNNNSSSNPMTEIKVVSNGLLGIIDYVDLENEQFIDWKTNARASLGYDYKLQAVMYRLLIKEEFDVDIKKFRFQFLFPNEFREAKFSNSKIMDIEKDLFAFVEQIKESWQTLNFPKKPRLPSTCKYCSYRYYCGGMQ